MPSNAEHPVARSARRAGRPVLMWGLLLVAAVALVIWPPVRLHRYEPGKPMSGSANASGGNSGALAPAQAAQRFWNQQLGAITEKAANARDVIAALRSDVAGARKRFARMPALGGPSYFSVEGSGKVISKQRNEIGIELDGSATPGEADVVISTGPLFGNAVRDGTGAFAPDDYPNSSDFNALSSELNTLVKANVFPPLRDLAIVGSRLRFAGVAEVAEDDPSPLPLNVVPMLVEFK